MQRFVQTCEESLLFWLSYNSLCIFFKMSHITADILEISKRVLDTIWTLLKMINSTKEMVDIDAYDAAAEKCFTAYTEVI